MPDDNQTAAPAPMVPTIPPVRMVLPDTLSDLLTSMRIGVTPEYEGGWHAAVYGEEAEAVATGEGTTPGEAVNAAIKAMTVTPPTSESST